MRENDRQKMRYNIVNTAGMILLICAAALVAWLLLLQQGDIQLRYAEIQNIMYEFQLTVASLDDKWLIIIIIELLFLLKSIIPIPVSFIFVLSGMVFPYSYAVLINAVGILILVTVKYFWGFKFGANKIDRKVLNYGIVQKILNKSYGKGAVLLLGRLLPWLPINKLSQLYGAMKYPFDRYLYVSLIAFSPKLFVYSVIGRNVYDPFSTKFIFPLIALFLISGISLLIINAVFGKPTDKQKSVNTTAI